MEWTTETIKDHPLWQSEVELERAMLNAGADSVRDQVVNATERDQLSRLKPIRNLINDWLPLVAVGIKDWSKAWKTTRGPRPLALQFLEPMDPYVVGVIGLRHILDGLTSKDAAFRAITPLALKIGETLEHEQKVRLWEEKEPDLFHSQRKKLDQDRSTDTHRRAVNINRFNALMAQGVFGFSWEPWGVEAHFRVGVEVINAIVRVTSWFEFAPDPEHIFRQGAKKGPRLILRPKEGLMEWFAQQLDHLEISSPAYMPTVVPPRRWEGTRAGGYWTPYVKSPRLVRFKASQEEQREHAAEEYDALDMPKVYDALHFLQEVPWRVNPRVYDVAKAIVSKDLGVAGIPLFRELELPRKPWDGMERGEADKWIAAHPEETKAWKREASPVHRKNALNFARAKMPSVTLRVAMQYLDHAFYFPHMMDFRGRMYPIPVGLQPQGDDLARGLLMFSEGKAITSGEGGEDWLAIALASAWGNDKVSFEDRVQWVRDRDDTWRRIAADPLGELDWATADKPFQVLAAIFEWVGWLDHGDGFVSHLPISVDGTCNGIQHLSAMTRDETAGSYVNLTPGEKPRDIYKFVADNLQRDILRIEANSCGLPEQQAAFWLNLLGREEGAWHRSLTKRQVMVVPYGGSREAFFTYTREWLKENDIKLPEDRDEANALVSFLVFRMWDAVQACVTGGTTVMKWLQDCAKAASGGNQPIFWKTVTGFVVRHFYGKVKQKEVAVMLDGRRTNVSIQNVTEALDVQRQLQGISPNFVHSQDAAALTLSILAAKAEGVSAFTAVHDAYGSHAADMNTVARCLRQAFVELHSEDTLLGFRSACLAVVADQLVTETGLDPLEAYEKADEKLPQLPERGTLQLEDVLRSDYFFA